MRPLLPALLAVLLAPTVRAEPQRTAPQAPRPADAESVRRAAAAQPTFMGMPVHPGCAAIDGAGPAPLRREVQDALTDLFTSRPESRGGQFIVGTVPDFPNRTNRVVSGRYAELGVPEPQGMRYRDLVYRRRFSNIVEMGAWRIIDHDPFTMDVWHFILDTGTNRLLLARRSRNREGDIDQFCMAPADRAVQNQLEAVIRSVQAADGMREL